MGPLSSGPFIRFVEGDSRTTNRTSSDITWRPRNWDKLLPAATTPPAQQRTVTPALPYCLPPLVWMAMFPLVMIWGSARSTSPEAPSRLS